MIYEIFISDWKELIYISNSLPGFVFRGQKEYNWTLSTNLERKIEKDDMTIKAASNREFWILTQFRRRAHNLIDKAPEDKEHIEWLALIQHHGGPTRLLDFTKSLFIALFFACEEAEGDSAIWIVDTSNIMLKYSKSEYFINDTIYHSQSVILDKASQIIGTTSNEKGIMPIEPERLNERMSIQQGLSIMPIDVNDTFMNNLKSEFGWTTINFEPTNLTSFMSIIFTKKVRVAKIKINAVWKNEIIHFLDSININSNTLFPGLDGFARSLVIHLKTSK